MPMDDLSVNTVDLIQRLEQSLSDSNEVGCNLQVLYDSFKAGEDASVKKEVVSFVFRSAIKVLPLEDIGAVVIEPFLPLVKEYLHMLLSSVQYLLKQGIPQELLINEQTKILQISSQLLSDLENALSYLLSFNKMSITLLFHLPINIAAIVKQVFIHCQRSKDEYKDTFTAMRSELMSLFQKCYKLQISLFALVNEKLVFNCMFEDELNLLVELLDIIGSQSEVVAELDTLSLVAHWKGYAQLAQTYATHLRPRLEVNKPISYLALNISHQLCSLKDLQNKDQKVIIKSLKITSLQLKVFIKLCEYYKGYIGDCHKDVNNCLITLLGHTDEYLRKQGLSDDIVGQVTATVTAGAAPLLTSLITDPCFVQVYFHQVERLPSSDLLVQTGYCHLTNLILKKLIQLSATDRDVQDLWLKPTLPMVNTVYEIMILCSLHGELVLREDDVYQTLVIHTVAFIATTCTSDMFRNLETLMLKHLLQCNLWPAMFSSDLMCLTARLGTNELCYEWTCLLFEVLSKWPPNNRYRPEWQYTSWTLSRLIPLLTQDHLKIVHAKFSSCISLAFDLSNIVGNPPSDQSVSIWNKVIDSLSLLGDTGILQTMPNCIITDTLHQLWQYMIVPCELGTSAGSHWFLGLYSALISVTCQSVNSFTNIQMLQILDVLMDICVNKTIIFHSGALEFLWCVATKTFSMDSLQPLICQKISLLFFNLLQENNPITNQRALETFLYFSHVTKYEQIVVQAIGGSAQMQSKIKDYFNQIPAKTTAISIEECLRFFGNTFVHTCNLNAEQNKLEISEIVPNPYKKLKTCTPDELFSVAIERIEKEMDNIEKTRHNNELDQQHTCRLRNISDRITKVLNEDNGTVL